MLARRYQNRCISLECSFLQKLPPSYLLQGTEKIKLKVDRRMPNYLPAPDPIPTSRFNFNAPYMYFLMHSHSLAPLVGINVTLLKYNHLIDVVLLKTWRSKTELRKMLLIFRKVLVKNTAEMFMLICLHHSVEFLCQTFLHHIAISYFFTLCSHVRNVVFIGWNSLWLLCPLFGWRVVAPMTWLWRNDT